MPAVVRSCVPGVVPFQDLGLAVTGVREEIDRGVAKVLDSGRYIGGSEVNCFEREFADYCGAGEAVGTGNGYDALVLMLRACGIGAGDDVIVPSNTYIATWLAVSAVGARVLPVEPDAQTLTIDPNRVEAALTRRTRAILAVHLYGRCANMPALREIARRRSLRLLVDAAQAHGIAHELQTDASAFSFYPTKNLGALGDAGAVVTNDAQIADRVRVLANYGSREKYFNEVRGVNSRLDSLQAAILRVKLKYLDRWNARRDEIARRYLRELVDVPNLVLPQASDDRQNTGTYHQTDGSLNTHRSSNTHRSANMVWHIFAVHHPQRERLMKRLAAEGVGTLIHYPQPPHLSEAYQDTGFVRGDFPLAERLADTELSLPLHPHLTEEEVSQVIAVTRQACLQLAPRSSAWTTHTATAGRE